MTTVKPFLLGAAVGSAVIFFALQYHIVQSKDGFRVVPRSPHHSLGLAYADVRHWDESQWADRPELVRALTAHGSTDLIDDAVAENISDALEDGTSATLDHLRSFLEESTSDSADSDSLFDSFGSPGTDTAGESSGDSGDQFSIPFPLSRRDKVESARLENDSAAPSRLRQIPSVDDVFQSGGGQLTDLREFSQQPVSRPDFVEPAGASEGTSRDRADRDAQLLEDMLFGDDATDDEPQQADDEFGIFEDVTQAIDRRATDIGTESPRRLPSNPSPSRPTRLTENPTSPVQRFVREQVEKHVPEPVRGMFSDDVPLPRAVQRPVDRVQSPDPPLSEEVPDAIRALREGFDPFIEF